MATMTEPTTRTLNVPGAVLTYDIRPNDASTELPLVAIGSPMGAGGFATLASHFPDRTVVTYDPRGVERSTKDDPSSESTPEQHGDDIHADHRRARRRAGRPVREQRRRGQRARARGAAPGRRPDARRPRAAAGRPADDHEHAMAATEGIRDTYQAKGFGPAMAQFILIVSHKGPIPAGFADQGSRTRRCSACRRRTTGRGRTRSSARTSSPCTHYQPDLDALRAAPTRIVRRGR